MLSEALLLSIPAFVVSMFTLYTTKKSKSQATNSEDKKTVLEDKKAEFSHEESQITTLLREVSDYRLEYKEARAERESWHEERVQLTHLILSLRMRIERLILVLEKHNIDIPIEVLDNE